MKNLRSNALPLVILMLVALGCGGLKNMIPKKGQYFEGDAAQVAAKAVKDKIGKSFKVVEIFIDENEFRIQAQDPNKPQNVDEYKVVGGSVSGPTPVQLGGMVDDAEKSSFPFDDIDFSAIPKFCKEALDRADIEGGKIYRLTFQRGFAMTDEGVGALGTARWHIEINGARENVTAAADPKGTLLGVDLSRTTKASSYKLLDEAELSKAGKMIKDFLGARKEILGVTFSDKYLMVKVPNAENPQVVDDYKYDINGLSKSGLVKGKTFPGTETFSIDEIDLANAARFYEKAKARAEMPNAALGSMSVSRRNSSFGSTDRAEWRVSLKSGVNEATVIYDNDGKERRVTKNGKKIFDADE